MPTDQPAAIRPEIDDETLAFARRVFQYARCGKAEELAALLEQGLPANLRNDKGDSLLMLAAYHGHADATRVILEAGGDPELVNDRGQTPLAGACFKGDAEIARLLIDKGARIDSEADGARTPLMLAAMFDRTEIVGMLLSRGADPRRRDASGATAAEMARSTEAAGALSLIEEAERAHGTR